MKPEIRDQVVDVLVAVFDNVPRETFETKVGIESFPEWDSLANFNVLMAVEETFNVQFEVDEMAELKDLDAICSAVEKHLKI